MEPEQADTIPELAKKFSLDLDDLDKTVKEFNAVINNKPFDLMKRDGKATTGLNSNNINSINRPPYYGYSLTAELTFTDGGIRANLGASGAGEQCLRHPGRGLRGRAVWAFLPQIPA